MQKVYIKSIFKMIQTHLGRFISIVIISILGSMVYVGLNATSYDIQKSVQKNIDEHKLYDYRIYSNYGFKKEDLAIFNNYKVESGIEFSAIGTYQNKKELFKIETLPEIHQVQLISGTYPKNDDEIIIRKQNNNQIKLEDEIDFSVNINTLNQTVFKHSKLKVVGIFTSNQYMSNLINGIDLASGFTNNVIYVTKSNITLENNTFINLYRYNNDDTFSTNYEDLLLKEKQQIEMISKPYVKNKFSQFKSDLINKVNQTKLKSESKINTSKLELSRALEQLNLKEEQLNQGYSKYYINQKKYETALQNFNIIQQTQAIVEDELVKQRIELEMMKTQLDSTLKTLNDGKKELNQGKEIYYKNKQLLEEQKQTFQQQIEQEYSKINRLQQEEWIITTRLDNQGIFQVKTRAENILNLSKVFPIIFFGVAVFVVSMSMTRMIDEERQIIATLKSLGYNNTMIHLRYLLYVFIATISGGIIGCLLGFYFITTMIYNTLNSLIQLPLITYVVSLSISIQSLVIMLVCTSITTLATIHKLLKTNTAQLLNGRNEIKGKSIILQHIKFVWNKMSFMQKVITRNLFINKKRFFLTIIGVAGCIVLMISGLGIKESIENVAEVQFSTLHKYQQKIQFNNLDDTILNIVKNNQGYLVYEAIYNLENEVIQLIEMNENTYSELFQSSLQLKDDEIIITNNLSKLKGYKINDTIELIHPQTKAKITLKITGITNNLIGYYVYVNNKVLQLPVNTIYLKSQLSQEDKIQLENNPNIKVIVSTSDLIIQLKQMTNSIDFAVYVLIIFSGILMFVVIYNLTNISISERKRELATLKVLGFYSNEVNRYVLKEVIILSLIGSLIGILLSKNVFELVMSSIEIPRILFPRILSLSTYGISVTLTMLCTYVVNVIMSKIIQKIDMLGALKAVE